MAELEILLQYGILGVWTLTLLIEKFNFQNKMRQVIENNTQALTKVYEVLQHCKR